MQKIVPVRVGVNKVTAVFIPDIEKEIVCPWCGADIFLGRNKFKIEMAVEWRRSRGWFAHAQDCPEFKMKDLRCKQASSALESERTDFVPKIQHYEKPSTESFSYLKGKKI